MKTCSKCGESKPLEAFHKASNAKRGYRSDCKQCVAVSSAKYRNANREKTREATRKYTAENYEKVRLRRKEIRDNDLEKVARYRAQYAAKRPDVLRDSAARYKAKFPEKVKAQYAAYAKKNSVHMAARAQDYRMRKSENQQREISLEDWATIVAMPCTACGVAGPSTVDHIVPVSRGGAHAIGNLMPLCGSCNSSKKDLLYIEWKYSKRPQAQKAFASP